MKIVTTFLRTLIISVNAFMTKQLLILIFALAMLMPYELSAQSVSIWDGTSEIWTSGQGTQSDPYLIDNAQQLAFIAEMVNGGVTTYEGVYFRLTNDLDMNNIAWEPIGNSTTQLFCGTFDGDNHFINNIRITGSFTYKGLFGITGSGFQCTSLGVKTTTTSSDGQYCGGIVGVTKGNTIIQDCYNTGAITATATDSYTYPIGTFAYSGGIVGFTGASNVADIGISTRIENCHNTGGISTAKSESSFSGGIVGCVGRYSNSNSIKNCYNIGEISSPNSYNAESGGIVGHIGSDAGIPSISIENCYNIGEISSSSPFNAYSGGIVGYNRGVTTLVKCYNNNNIITSTNISGYTGSRSSGGLIGYSGNSSITITYSYNRGNVVGISTAGGIIGYIGDESSSVINSYNTGTLTGSTKGGICGNTTGSVSNCYYLSTCGGIVAGGISKTEAAMKSASFPVLLNASSTVFEMDVTPNVNDGYPIFGTDIILITTKAATNLNFTSVTLKGNYETQSSWPGGDADVVGFEYKKTSATNYTTVYTNVGTPASYNLTGLQLGTEYQYRMFVQKNGVTYYGQIITFSTLTCDLQASIMKSATAICQGDTAVFTVSCSSSHSDTFNYRWSNNSTTNQIQVNNANTYAVTVSDANGCSATASASVTVNPVPQGVISGNTTLCSGQSSTLTASGANSYRWNTGATSPVITVNNSGTYTCTFSNSYGCTSTNSAVVTIFDAPIITGNTVFCAGDYTTLTASGGDDYLWSTGATTPTINVNTAGTYSVTATTTNNCSATTSVMVIQNQASDVVILGNSVICSGIGTSLTASTGVSYLWSTGETTQSIATNNPGIYSVTVTNSSGCTSSASQIVSYMELPIITGNTTICSGESTTLSANASGSYLWSTGAVTPSIIVNTPGNYSVTVSIANGCSSSAAVNVTTASLPTPTIIGNTTICQGETATLVATGGTSYQWSAMGQGNSITVTEAGTYTVTVTNAQGCSATASTYVTVNPLPNITISGNTAVCQGNTTTLVANGATTYQWSNGVSGAVNTIGTFGIYTVTGISAEGCSNTASATVVVYQLPVLNISGDTQLCSGETTTLTANGAATYLWNNGTTDAALTTGAAGTYTVIGTDEHGCYSTASIDVAVNYPSSTEVTVVECDSYEWQGITRTESGDYTWTGQTAAGCDSIVTLHLTINESVTAEISETASNSYEWHGTTYTESGDYTWTVQTANGCDSTVTLHLTITTGVNEWGDGYFTVYPNPTTGMINVQFSMNNVQLEDVDIQIFDVYGRLLRTVETCHGASLQTTQIDLSQYAPGVYLIQMVGDGRVMGVQKVVKR